jgi:hypothetical protein
MHVSLCQEGYFYFFYYYLVCEAIGTAATPGLLFQPRMIVKMIMEKQLECGRVGDIGIEGSLAPDTTLVATRPRLGPLQNVVLDKELDLITAFRTHSITLTLY